MPQCPNCGTLHYYPYCLICESRREELLRRLEHDRKATPFSEIAAQGMFIGDRKQQRLQNEKEAVTTRGETLRRCWRVG